MATTVERLTDGQLVEMENAIRAGLFEALWQPRRKVLALIAEVREHRKVEKWES